MRNLLTIAILALWLPAQAAEVVTLTITVSNAPVTSNTLVVNAASRYWTNASASATIATNLTGTAPSATNLFNQIASFPYTGPLTLQWLTSTQMTLRTILGGSISASAAGGWATLTLNTQSGPSTFTALWPIENMVGATNRTNQASSLVSGLSNFSTQALAATSTTVSNLANLYHPQTIAGNKTFTGTNAFVKGGWDRGSFSNAVNVSGTLGSLTNGYLTNAILSKPTMTNGANYGTAFRSPGSGGRSEQFGSNALATGTASLAVGADSAASGDYALAIGSASIASASSGIALGVAALASGTNSLSFGSAAEATTNNAIAIGAGASTGWRNSISIGTSAAAGNSNQVVLGTSSYTTDIPGVFAPSGTLTNLTIRGTNVINGRVDFTSRANTGLANGNNAGVVLGTNVYIRLSGATTIAAIAGFAAEQDGSWHIVQISGSVTNTILNESGVDATAANRIVTGTGADYSFTNSPSVIYLHYDATASRWRLRLDR
jgi:hypothetical protein